MSLEDLEKKIRECKILRNELQRIQGAILMAQEISTSEKPVQVWLNGVEFEVKLPKDIVIGLLTDSYEAVEQDLLARTNAIRDGIVTGQIKIIPERVAKIGSLET
ncbi:MAG: hypothetical protein WC954_05260 [Sphaerochaeta sp.]